MASKPKPKRRYASGGLVDMPEAPKFAPMASTKASFGSGFASGAKVGVDLAQAYKDADASKKKDDYAAQAKADPLNSNDDTFSRGGRIKRTVGPRIGKEDGLIAAQKGEYVIKKAAVNKLGNKALATINRGKLPQKRGR